jgi:hypothetical protein
MPNVVRVPSLRMTEIDGSPDVQGVERIFVTNSYLSNLGGGAVLLSLSGSADIQFTPPVSGDFSWDNQGGASVSTSDVGIFLSIPASASISLRSRYKAAPTPPYVITAAFVPLFFGTNTFDTYGFIWSDGTKFATFGVGYNTGVTGGYYLLSGKWTSSTVYAANYLALAYSQFGPLVWLRIADNNTNRICSLSSDGQNWVVFDTQTRTDHLTPTRVGFGASATNGTYASGLTLRSWKETV